MNTTDTVRALMDGALKGGGDVTRFQKRWPEPASAEAPIQGITWEQLERQLSDLAGSKARSEAAGPLVSALRKQSWCKPPEMVLREILCVAWTLLDESFEPELSHSEDDSP